MKVLTRGAYGIWAAACLLMALSLAGCAGTATEAAQKAGIVTALLFPANDRVLATYCNAGLAEHRRCQVAAWDLDGANLKVYRKPEGHFWTVGGFSPNGREVVLEIAESRRLSTKLAILNLQSERVRIVEGSDSYKFLPSYHPKGGKLIFAKAVDAPDDILTKRNEIAHGSDIHTLDLATGETTALTDYGFAIIETPYYTGRGDEFVYGGYDPWKVLYGAKSPKPIKGRKFFERYDDLYWGNTVISVNEVKNDWRPDFLIKKRPSSLSGIYARYPVPAEKDSKLYFQSNKGEIGQYEDANYSTAIWVRENQQNRRLLYFGKITGMVRNRGRFNLSQDKAFFLIHSRGLTEVGAKPDAGLWRVTVDGVDPRRIPIPWDRLAAVTAAKAVKK